MNTGARVTLVAFNGKRWAPSGTPPKEDYWKLIGWHGTLIDGGEEKAHFLASGPKARVCVDFDRDVRALGLEAHNLKKESLWVLRSDLRAFEGKPGQVPVTD